jgi:hypothetical protein
MAGGVAHFAARYGRALEPHVGEDEQERRLRERTVCWQRCDRITLRVDNERACHDEKKQRDQLPYGEGVRQGRRHAYPDDICDGQSRDHCDYAGGPPHAGTCNRSEKPDVPHKQVAERRKPCHSPEPHQPTDLKSDQRAERRACVQVRATGRAKTAADFRKTQNDETDSNRGQQIREQAVRSS